MAEQEQPTRNGALIVVNDSAWSQAPPVCVVRQWGSRAVLLVQMEPEMDKEEEG